MPKKWRDKLGVKWAMFKPPSGVSSFSAGGLQYWIDVERMAAVKRAKARAMLYEAADAHGCDAYDRTQRIKCLGNVHYQACRMASPDGPMRFALLTPSSRSMLVAACADWRECTVEGPVEPPDYRPGLDRMLWHQELCHKNTATALEKTNMAGCGINIPIHRHLANLPSAQGAKLPRAGATRGLHI